MNNQKKTEKRRVGDLGEDIACKFLMKQGFSIADRNYLKKWGEIDIIAKKKGVTHFIEVKTVTRLLAEVSTQAGENIGDVTSSNAADKHETGGYRPEENVHPRKLARMRRVIQSYLLEKDIEEGNWQFDVITVLLDIKNREAKCEYLENIIL